METRARLEYELEAMKRISKQGLELRVQWLPREDGPLSGEVKGDVIYIYESEEKKALDVLEHEFVDYLVTMGIDPFKLMVNSLIKLVNRMRARRNSPDWISIIPKGAPIHINKRAPGRLS